jgi:hypothetical protein
MGQAFYRTMNIPDLVAKSRDNYVDIATRLSTEADYYRSIRKLIGERSHLLWEDMEVPFVWSQLLSHAVGVQAMTWDEFIQSTGRNVTRENELLAARQLNRQDFARVWGDERYMLDARGVAVMETRLPVNLLQVPYEDLERALDIPSPRIFNNWKSSTAVASGEVERGLGGGVLTEKRPNKRYGTGGSGVINVSANKKNKKNKSSSSRAAPQSSQEKEKEQGKGQGQGQELGSAREYGKANRHY